MADFRAVLKDVLSAKRTRLGGDFIDLQVVADLGDGQGEQTLPFTYHPDDPFGLTPQVKVWLAKNGDRLTVEDYVPPPPPPELTPAEKLEAAAKRAGFDSAREYAEALDAVTRTEAAAR